jgi:hypothetical protein
MTTPSMVLITVPRKEKKKKKKEKYAKYWSA